MFELNDDLNITIVSDIGISKKRSVIVDNFYKNPDEVRNLCLNSHQITPEEDPGMIADLPGNRVWIETKELTDKIMPLFTDLCFDEQIWDRTFDFSLYWGEWSKSAFMCNVVNDDTLLRNPSSIIPHQDSYCNSPGPQFGAVVYLNTPQECSGGTSFYSFDSEMTIPLSNDSGITKPENVDSMTQEEIFSHIRYNITNGNRWKSEYDFEMVYNRMILYESDVLHGINVDIGMFSNFSRINQIVFM